MEKTKPADWSADDELLMRARPEKIRDLKARIEVLEQIIIEFLSAEFAAEKTCTVDTLKSRFGNVIRDRLKVDTDDFFVHQTDLRSQPTSAHQSLHLDAVLDAAGTLAKNRRHRERDSTAKPHGKPPSGGSRRA